MYKNKQDTAKATNKNGILIYIQTALQNQKLGELLVLKGYISQSDLRHALSVQNDTKKPIGQIFVQQKKITKLQLLNVLTKQKALRIAATLVLYASSFTCISKKTYAGDIKDVSARIMLASAQNTTFEKISEYPALFGADEKRSTELKAFTKWSEMFKRFDAALNKESAQPIIASLKNELAGYRSSSIYDMAKDVNAMMNRTKYISDNKNWGKSDYWATPIEFLTRGGDCEDFAIAKYSALRALGVPENRMRIAIVQDLQKNIPHAILIVYSEKGVVVLDNQIKTMRRADSISHYKPIFSINREAWWLHTAPGTSTTIVASAR